MHSSGSLLIFDHPAPGTPGGFVMPKDRRVPRGPAARRSRHFRPPCGRISLPDGPEYRTGSAGLSPCPGPPCRNPCPRTASGPSIPAGCALHHLACAKACAPWQVNLPPSERHPQCPGSPEARMVRTPTVPFGAARAAPTGKPAFTPQAVGREFPSGLPVPTADHPPGSVPRQGEGPDPPDGPQPAPRGDSARQGASAAAYPLSGRTLRQAFSLAE